MAALLLAADALLPPLPAVARLAILVTLGAGAYAGLLLAFARRTVDEVLVLIRPQPAADAAS
jgi:hypothetical protein